MAGGDCDAWAEPDSAWHLGWQAAVPPQRREVVFDRAGERHRADMVAHDGTVVEVQHSAISVGEIAEREAFYGPRMAWIFDATTTWANDRFLLRGKPDRDGAPIVTFRWKHARKSVAASRRVVLLDLGRALVQVRRIWPDAPCGGWGRLVRRTDLEAWLAHGTPFAGVRLEDTPLWQRARHYADRYDAGYDEGYVDPYEGSYDDEQRDVGGERRPVRRYVNVWDRDSAGDSVGDWDSGWDGACW